MSEKLERELAKYQKAVAMGVFVGTFSEWLEVRGGGYED